MATASRANCFTETNQKIRVPLTAGVNEDGGALVPTAAAGKFGIVSGAFGAGGYKLQGEQASGNTKTSTVKYRVPLPQNYVAGEAFSIKVKQRVTVIANTTANIDVEARKSDDQGGVGADQVTTSAQTNNAITWVEHTFSVTGTSFVPGDEVDVLIRCQANDSGGANNSASEIGSVTLAISTKM